MKPGVIDRAVRGSELSPLSKEQKATICILAREAYDKVGIHSGDDYEAWRHDQQQEACGRSSLCTATQKDYRALRGHFRALLGHKRAALRDFVASEVGDPGFVLAKLNHECTAASDVIARPFDYVQSIAKARFKTADLRSLSAKQVWNLVFDLRRDAQRRRRKAA
ncbi:MAG TPA: hypothetical protein PKC67_02490 [Kiritimatiellia bacterium]|nr:hypothetical protein [Kiritimatiellia bacterium]HMP33194.1 hypothetical protein [Kiritimatiellia bacterium]